MAINKRRTMAALVIYSFFCMVLGVRADVAGSDRITALSYAQVQDTVSLSGLWKFQPGDDLNWAAPGFDDSDWRTRRVPGRWPEGGYPETGQMAWYRLSIQLDPQCLEQLAYGVQLGLRMGKVSNAYEVYVDGRMLDGVGKLPPSPQSNYDRERVFPIPASAVGKDGILLLAIRVWGGGELAVNAWGAGLHGRGYAIGDYSTLVETETLSQLPSLVVGALSMSFGVYLLYLFYLNRKILEFLWFGLLAIDIGVYGLMLSQWKYHLDWSFLLFKKIEFGSVYLGPALAIQMLWILLALPINAWLRACQLSFVLAALVVVVVPGSDVHVRSLALWQLCVLLLLCYSAWVILAQVRLGNREARTLLIGALIFIITCVNDLMIELFWVDNIHLIPYGFVAMMAAMAGSLANRFTSLFNSLEREVVQRTADLSAANERLAEMAHQDPLTGLLNRRGFSEACREEIQRCSRTGRPFSIVLADLDRFKCVNDRYGHAAGDKVLQQVADLLRQRARDMDHVGRWGGEEFIMLLPETSAAGAAILAEEQRAAIAATLFEFDASPLQITMTFGVTQYCKNEDLDDTISRADAALYEGKEQGRNRIRVQLETELTFSSAR